MKYAAVLLLMLSIGLCAQAQKVPEYKTIEVKILKIEIIRERESEPQSTYKLTMRDSRGIIYRASRWCGVTAPSNSEISCARLGLPLIGETYTVKVTFGGTLIYFGEIVGPGFEIDSEEVSGCAEAK